MCASTRRLRIPALLGCLLAAAGAAPTPAHADGVVNGQMITSAGIPPGAYPGQPVEPVRPTNLVFIDFDDAQQPCLFMQTDPLRDAYQSLGVLFSGPGSLDGGAILDQCGNFDVSRFSPPNFVAFNAGAQMLSGGRPIGPERMTFLAEVSSVSVGVASNTAGFAVLRAYDSASLLIATASVPLSGTLQDVSVAIPGIRYADLGVQGGSEVWIFDNLAFDATPTPVTQHTWGRIKELYR